MELASSVVREVLEREIALSEMRRLSRRHAPYAWRLAKALCQQCQKGQPAALPLEQVKVQLDQWTEELGEASDGRVDEVLDALTHSSTGRVFKQVHGQVQLHSNAMRHYLCGNGELLDKYRDARQVLIGGGRDMLESCVLRISSSASRAMCFCLNCQLCACSRTEELQAMGCTENVADKAAASKMLSKFFASRTAFGLRASMAKKE